MSVGFKRSGQHTDGNRPVRASQRRRTACLLGAIGLLCLAGCGGDTPANAAADFAPGAFPPTLSGEEYHVKSWTRTDCLTCHEQGMKEAPVMRHVSVPEIAADAKCRTCHVLIADQKAPD